jgi:holliday junction DNA helicase RuvA
MKSLCPSLIAIELARHSLITHLGVRPYHASMISRIEGTLLAIAEGKALLGAGHLTYELLVPGADQQRLNTMVGQVVQFHTLHYFENQNQGAAYIPRLIGFNSPDDRAFFELFTTVKGIGNRKALRSLQLPFGTIASAIAEKDVDLLKSLPEIGQRTAETIIVELHGKVDRFVELKHAGTDQSRPLDDARAQVIHDAVNVMSQLGESKLTARQLAERALTADPTIADAEALLAAAYRLKDLG